MNKDEAVGAAPRLVLALILALAGWLLLPGAGHAQTPSRGYTYDARTTSTGEAVAAGRLEYAFDATGRFGQRYDRAATICLGNHVPLTGLRAAEGVATDVGGPGALQRLLFEASSKHPDVLAETAQGALDNSLQVAETTTRRVGIDYGGGRFMVFDETYPGQGIFHGHFRAWDELTQSMQSVLRRAGMAGGRGDILTGPG